MEDNQRHESSAVGRSAQIRRADHGRAGPTAEFDERGATMFVTKKALSRREILRGAGVTLALPLSDAMVPALTAMAQTAAKPTPRLGYFYVPNGMSMPYWRPKTDGAHFESSPILSVLEPYRDSTTVISGLNNYQSTLGAGG